MIGLLPGLSPSYDWVIGSISDLISSILIILRPLPILHSLSMLRTSPVFILARLNLTCLDLACLIRQVLDLGFFNPVVPVFRFGLGLARLILIHMVLVLLVRDAFVPVRVAL